MNFTVPVGVPVVADFTVAVNVTVWPEFDGFIDEATLLVVPALFTTCFNTAEVLPTNFESPLYTAVIECVPTVRVEVTNVAFPLLSATAPKMVAPFLNVTVPVGVPPEPDTVAVSVIEWPHCDGFAEEASVVVESFSTTWVNAAGPLARK